MRFCFTFWGVSRFLVRLNMGFNDPLFFSSEFLDIFGGEGRVACSAVMERTILIDILQCLAAIRYVGGE